MRVLLLVLAVAVALLSINDGVVAKAAVRSDLSDFTALEGDIASDEAESEERKIRRSGGGGGGGGGGGRRRRRRARRHGEEEDEFVALPPGCYLGPEFGGPHGDDFTDADSVQSGQKVASINLRARERIDAVILTIVGKESPLYHGGDGGDLKTPLALAEGEHITTMEAHVGKQERHTRVKYLNVTTNFGNWIDGGTRTDKIGTDKAQDGYQLVGFDGRSGDELDLVSAIWCSIQPVV